MCVIYVTISEEMCVLSARAGYRCRMRPAKVPHAHAKGQLGEEYLDIQIFEAAPVLVGD